MSSTKSTKETIVRDTAKYSFAFYASQGVGFVTSVSLRRFLGPYAMGIWSLLQVVQSYIKYLNLGVDSAAVYRIPFYRGKGEKLAAEKVKDTTFSFIFLISLLSCLGLVIAALYFRNKYPLEVIVGLLALAVYIILQRMYAFYIVILRAYGSFSILSKSLLFDSIANLFLVLLLVNQFKLYGLYFIISFLAVLNTLFVHRLAKEKIIFKFDLRQLKALIVYGFPILLNSVLGVILRSIGQIMIAKMMGIIFVGYYSIALMTKNYVYGFSNNLYIVTIPHMQEAYGRKEKIEDIRKFLIVPTKALSYLLAPFLGVIYFTLPLFIEKFLPQYIPGIVTAQILLLDIFFYSCSSQASQFLITLNKQKIMIPITAAAIVISIVFNYCFIKNNWGITGVAIATSIASFFSFVSLLIYGMKHFGKGEKIFQFILSLIFPLVYVIVVIAICNYFFANLNQYLKLGLNISVLLVSSLPLFYYIDRKTKILHMIISMVKNKIKGG